MSATPLGLSEQARGITDELPRPRLIISLSVVTMSLATAVILFTGALLHFSYQWSAGTDSLKWACWLTGMSSIVTGVQTIHSCARTSSASGLIVFSWIQSALFLASLTFAMETWGKIY